MSLATLSVPVKERNATDELLVWNHSLYLLQGIVSPRDESTASEAPIITLSAASGSSSEDELVEVPPMRASRRRRRMSLMELAASYEAAAADADYVADMEETTQTFDPTVGDGLS